MTTKRIEERKARVPSRSTPILMMLNFLKEKQNWKRKRKGLKARTMSQRTRLTRHRL
jgi:hypothetical protein